MAKNIVVITGSGRLKGNSAILADAFIKGAIGAGHEVSRFDAAVDRVQGCIGCDTCWSKGKPCTFDDGFDKLYPMLEKADVVVFAGPVYWYTFTTFLKGAIDKLYAYYGARSKKKLKIAESALLMTAEDTNDDVFKAPVESYRSIAGLNGWKDRGAVLVHSVNAVGEVNNTDGPARAEKLGREI